MPAGGGRARRGWWFDPRFAIGIVLIAAGVVGVSAVVRGADEGSTVYAARSALTVGERIGADDLVPVTVRLDGRAGRYLAPGRMPADGVVVTRGVGAGELVPSGAVGDRARAEDTSVVVPIDGTLPAGIVAGAVVDVWSAPHADATTYGAPGVIASRAVVTRTSQGSGLVGSDRTTAVELTLPRSRVASVLEAVANDDRLAIVPADTPLSR